MKYYNYQVTFSEVPDEVSLCINLTNCPIHCPACHSKHLWEDNGIELTQELLNDIIKENTGVTCVCFMGGDADYNGLKELVDWVKEYNRNNPPCLLKTCVYSGRTVGDLFRMAGNWIQWLDYLKTGPYKEEYGGLDSRDTNQRFYHISVYSNNLIACMNGKNPTVLTGDDWTYKFWK